MPQTMMGRRRWCRAGIGIGFASVLFILVGTGCRGSADDAFRLLGNLADDAGRVGQRAEPVVGAAQAANIDLVVQGAQAAARRASQLTEDGAALDARLRSAAHKLSDDNQDIADAASEVAWNGGCEVVFGNIEPTVAALIEYLIERAVDFGIALLPEGASELASAIADAFNDDPEDAVEACENLYG